jgi:hypothetical protein
LTDRILNLLRPRVKPLADPAHDRAYTVAVGQVLRAGERVREVNAWRDGYSFRTGRAA